MTTHDVSVFPVAQEGNRRPQWFAACTCGWDTALLATGSNVTAAAAAHLKLNAPKGKD